MSAEQRRLATIMFTDMVGYSARMHRDEPLALEMLEEQRGLLRQAFLAHSGHEIEAVGDGFFVEFGNALGAVQCAVEIQRRLAERNGAVPPGRRFQVRIGLHLGDVVAREERVHGDGVNIAARIEPLAEPGGICLSEDVARQVQNKIEYPLHRLGTGELKNIDTPVGIYRLALPWEERHRSWLDRLGFALRRRDVRRAIAAAPALVVLAVLALSFLIGRGDKAGHQLPDRPSVAVLPFTNMSGDREQDYFADGLTEDIITSLSHFRELFIIARNSTAAYKGQPVNIEEVGQRLGVRYVLEGSVRRTNDRVRITAQLIDATTGGHVWAHAYDERLQDLFTVQDEVIRQLVGALGVSIRDAEKQRILRKPTDDLNAYDLVLRAGQLWAEASPTEHLQLRNLTERAVALDPGYARAQAMLAFAYLDEYRWKYNPHPDRPDPLKSARERAELAVRLDPADAYTHYALAKIAYYAKELDLAEREFNKTFALNPSAADPRADWGIRLAVMGRPDEGVALTREAMRLNPAYPSWYHFTLAADALHKADFDRAVAESENIGLRQLFWTQIFLCASYAHAGRTEEARAAAREILKLYPSIEKDWDSQTTGMHSWDPSFKDIVTQGLRKARLFADAK